MSTPHHWSRSQRGLTLIELMVAMVIGLLLILAVSGIYIATQKAVRLTHAQAAIQENARAGLDFIRKEVRLAGFSSVCLTMAAERRGAHHHLSELPPSTLFDADAGIQGYAYNVSGTPDPEVGGAPVAAAASDFTPTLAAELRSSTPGTPVPIKNSDVLVVRYAVPIGGVQLLAKNKPSVNVLEFAAGSGVRIAKNRLLRAERCVDEGVTDVFVNQSAPPSNGSESTQVSKSSPGEWHSDYVNDGHLYYYEIHAFYVGVDPASGLPGLYRYTFGLTGTGTRDLLIPGVTSMRVRYHLSVGDRYITAKDATPTTWFGVDGAEIGLLLQNTQRGADVTNRTFELLPGASVKVTNSPYLFKPVRTSVALRNRLVTKP